MEKSEFRILIKHTFLMGKNATQSKTWLDKCYGESAPSRQMVEKWFREFKCGRTSTEAMPSPGRPNEVTTEEMINKIHDIALNDRRVKLSEIADIVHISKERVGNILHEHLDMRKLSARWVPRLLTIDQKRKGVTTSMECLDMFKKNPDEFLRRFITVGETWIHHYTSETKNQSKQ